jgi:deoxyribodipyrimidine photo-lyase
MKWQVLWLKRDLRVHDHEALYQFCQILEPDSLPVAVYALEPEMWAQPDMSWRQAQFIEQSLLEQYHALNALNIPLILIENDVISFLDQLPGKVVLYSHQETGNAWTFQRDLTIKQWCHKQNATWFEFLQHPIKRAGIDRDHYEKFAHQFWDQVCYEIPEPLPEMYCQNVMAALSDVEGIVQGESVPHSLAKGGVIPVAKFWPDFMGRYQKGGRSRGELCLQRILERKAQNYLQTVAKPEQGAKFSSRLSPHLAWGTLSIREVMQQARFALSQDRGNRNLRAFVSRLHWQSHFMQKLEAEPAMEFHALHPMYESLRSWQPESSARFEAWSRGMTGIPFVDACMRSLLINGWLPFRMRAMLMSFASYQLWLPWQKTAPYLASLFTDYEPGIHYSQVQMQSGVTGINQMRVYNPVKQGLDHDAKATFISRFCPELKTLPIEYIHQPWQMTSLQQQGFGVLLGKDYPKPIVEHESAARSAKQAMADVRDQAEHKALSKAVFVKHGSRRRQPQTHRRRSTKKMNSVTLQAETLKQNQMSLFDS